MSLQPLQMLCIGTDCCLVLMPCRTLRLHQNSTTTTIATPTTNTAWQTRWTTFEAPFKTPIKLLSCCSSQGMGWHSTVPDSAPTATANCLTPFTTAAWLPCFFRRRTDSVCVAVCHCRQCSPFALYLYPAQDDVRCLISVALPTAFL